MRLRRLLGLLLFSWPAPATRLRAQCAFPEDHDRPKPVQAVESWNARHVDEGTLPGCLVRLKRKDAGEAFVAYTPYRFICGLPKDEVLVVDTLWACCDAGEQGDFACGVKPANPFAQVGTSITVVPHKPDRRGIPDLMANLKHACSGGARPGFSRLNASSIAGRLLEYHGVPEFRADILKLIPALKDLRRESRSEEPKAAVSDLLLRLGEGKPGSDLELELALDVLRGARFGFAPRDLDALRRVRNHPAAGEAVVPVLLEHLGHGSELADTKAALEALPDFGAALKPHLIEIHELLGGSADAAPAWRRIVCAAFPSAPGERASRVLFDDYSGARKIPPVDCP